MDRAPLIVACAVWGNWPKNRVGKGARFFGPQPPTGKGRRYLDRGGRAELQPEYIRRLANGVARNLAVPHRFVCFADDVAKVPAGIEAWPLDVPYISRGMPKAYIYGAPFTGCPIEAGTRVLVFDLDTVIVGDLSDMVRHNKELVVRERGYMLPQMVPDGDCIYALAGSAKAKACADIYHREMANKCAGTECGDERILLTDVGAAMWGHVCPGQVVSYKRHCKTGLPKGARVVSFHGRPLPDQAPDKWVRRHWA